MANTIRAAKNTFGGGLVMDLSPDTTPNEVLTSALNATLVTFNGNELLLQNDMGNGRVETARLPDGYIPVGTCEFGDIIYIVSYNPLTNRSQIGCFPSPERVISSEEIGSTGQTLSSSDFQEGYMENGAFVPNGLLKTSSVKKVLYNKKMNPGDKFVIYDKTGNILAEENISDLGNTSHKYGTDPKLLKIHVIAIEDSGKITFLDSTLRWYELTTEIQSNGHTTTKVADYFITTGKQDDNKTPDIDEYRNVLSSGYSIFQSKISGKLALLIELEKIDGFSCTYSIKKDEEVTDDNSKITYGKYTVSWNYYWDTHDLDINPRYLVLTKSDWSDKSYYTWQYENEQLISNVVKEIDEVTITTLNTTETVNNLPIPYAISNQGLIVNADYWYHKVCSDSIGFKLRLDTFLTSPQIQLASGAVSIYGLYGLKTALTKLSKIDDKYLINLTNIDKRMDDNENEVITYYTANNKKILPVTIHPYILNNYFNYPSYAEFNSFWIPQYQEVTVENNTVTEKVDTTNLIYNYEITPAMPYGLLSEYAVEGYINFNKVGSGEISLNTWKYFVGQDNITLTLGMDAYLEENKGIKEVVLEFYDNQQTVNVIYGDRHLDNQPAMAAAYYITDKVSYSGQFTEIIPLNGSFNTYKMSNTNAKGKVCKHAGLSIQGDETNIIELTAGGVTTKHVDDCGTIYNNMLYLVKIVVKYTDIDVLGNYTEPATDSKTFYRWVWTNGLFNEYYYSVRDFDNIKFNLTLDNNVSYNTGPDYVYRKFNYLSPNKSITVAENELYRNLSADVQVISTIDKIKIPEVPKLNPDDYTLDQSQIQFSCISSNQVFVLTIPSEFPVINSWDNNKFTLTIDGSPAQLHKDPYQEGGNLRYIWFMLERQVSNGIVEISGQEGAFKYGRKYSPAFTKSVTMSSIIENDFKVVSKEGSGNLDNGGITYEITMNHNIGSYVNDKISVHDLSIPEPETTAYEEAVEYVLHHWNSTKGSLSGYNEEVFSGNQTALSKLNYWIEYQSDIYVFISVDYGEDIWRNLYNYKGSPMKMLNAKHIIEKDENDPYIKEMFEYAEANGYNASVDAKYDFLYYSPDVLIWLKEIIEKNTNKNVFVFGHHFIPHKVGNVVNGWTYLVINSSDVKEQDSNDNNIDSLPVGANALSGVQFWFFNGLCNNNPHVIFFSGHSHISWKNLEVNHITNRDYDIVSPTTGTNKTVYTKSSDSPKGDPGAYWVALPSLCKPREIKNDGTAQVNMNSSEYAIMDVYVNGIKIKTFEGMRTELNGLVVYLNNSIYETSDILLRGEGLGGHKYSVGLISDIHSCRDNEANSDPDDNLYDEDDLLNALDAFKDYGINHDMVKFIVSCGDVTESWPYTGSENYEHAEFPIIEDSNTFSTVYGSFYEETGIRFLTCLGNHDHYGIFEYHQGDDDEHEITERDKYEDDEYNYGIFGPTGRLSYWNNNIATYSKWRTNARATFTQVTNTEPLTTNGKESDINYFEYGSIRSIYGDPEADYYNMLSITVSSYGPKLTILITDPNGIVSGGDTINIKLKEGAIQSSLYGQSPAINADYTLDENKGLDVHEEEGGNNLGTYQYAVGIISDIHFCHDNNTTNPGEGYITTDSSGNGSSSGLTSLYAEDLAYLLSDPFKSVKFIASPGDIVTYNINDAIEFYKVFDANRKNNIPFYCAIGNHDHLYIYSNTPRALQGGTNIGVLNNGSSPSDYDGARWSEFTFGGNTYKGPGKFKSQISGTTLLDFGSRGSYYVRYNDDIYIFLQIDYATNADDLSESVEGGTTESQIFDSYSTAHAHHLLNFSDPNVIKMYNFAFNEIKSESGYTLTTTDLGNHYNFSYQYYNPADLIYVYNLIKDNLDCRIFFFSHHFLPHKAGGANKYSRGGSANLWGLTFLFLNKLNNTYKNVVWFSGHSHYQWNFTSGEDGISSDIAWTNKNFNYNAPSLNYTLSYNNANMMACTNDNVYLRGSGLASQENTAWNIHIPSTSRPAGVKNDATCEAALLEVYSNGVKITKLGYSTSDNGATYTPYSINDDTLIIYNDGTWSDGKDEPTPGPTPVPISLDDIPMYEENGTNDIVLRIINACNEDAWLNGKLTMYYHTNPDYAKHYITQAETDAGLTDTYMTGLDCALCSAPGLQSPNPILVSQNKPPLSEIDTSKYVVKCNHTPGTDYSGDTIASYVSGDKNVVWIVGHYMYNHFKLEKGQYIERVLSSSDANTVNNAYWRTLGACAWEKGLEYYQNNPSADDAVRASGNPPIKLATTIYTKNADDNNMEDADITGGNYKEYYLYQGNRVPTTSNGAIFIVRPLKESDGSPVLIKKGRTYNLVIEDFNSNYVVGHAHRVSHNDKWNVTLNSGYTVSNYVTENPEIVDITPGLMTDVMLHVDFQRLENLPDSAISYYDTSTGVSVPIKKINSHVRFEFEDGGYLHVFKAGTGEYSSTYLTVQYNGLTIYGRLNKYNAGTTSNNLVFLNEIPEAYKTLCYDWGLAIAEPAEALISTDVFFSNSKTERGYYGFNNTPTWLTGDNITTFVNSLKAALAEQGRKLKSNVRVYYYKTENPNRTDGEKPICTDELYVDATLVKQTYYFPGDERDGVKIPEFEGEEFSQFCFATGFGKTGPDSTYSVRYTIQI